MITVCAMWSDHSVYAGRNKSEPRLFPIRHRSVTDTAEQTDPVAQLPVYFFSSTSNLIRRFASNLHATDGRPVRDLSERTVRSSEAPGPWILLTPSYKAGNDAHATLPAAVRAFLRSPANRRRLVGIIGSGNRNFGDHYQAAARELARVSGRPVVFEFELAGTPEDVAECARILTAFDARFGNAPEAHDR